MSPANDAFARIADPLLVEIPEPGDFTVARRGAATARRARAARR